jgi:hypothetical protein
MLRTIVLAVLYESQANNPGLSQAAGYTPTCRAAFPCPTQPERGDRNMPAETRDRPTSRQIRHLFFLGLIRQLRVVWPILSGVLVTMAAIGLVIGRIEGWGIGESLYFTYVTGLTIGYGDFAPKTGVGRSLAMVLGFAGIVLTGLVAAVTVQALNATARDHTE